MHAKIMFITVSPSRTWVEGRALNNLCKWERTQLSSVDAEELYKEHKIVKY